MTTGVLLTPPIIQFTLNNGALAVNGSVLTQVGGVNTATYADSGLATPLPNPIPLNSRGEVSNAVGASCQCFLTPNTVYVFTLFDGPNGTGNQIWQGSYVNGIQITAAQVNALSSNAPVLSSLSQTGAEIGAGATPTNFAYMPGDVRRYGADPSGVTDSTNAIQAAINVSGFGMLNNFTPANFNPACYLPPGTYKISSSLTLISQCCIRGDAHDTTIIKQTASVPIFVNGAVDSTGAFTRTTIRNVALRGGTYGVNYTLTGTQVQSLGFWENVRFELQTIAPVNCNQYFLVNTFINCVFSQAPNAIVCGAQANLNNWISCRFESINGNTITFNNSIGGSNGGEVNNFIGCRFEGRLGATGFFLLTQTNGICTTFDGCYFEDTWKHILVESGQGGLNCTTFRNCKFTGQENTGSFQKEIFMSDGIVQLENCYFLTGTDPVNSTADFMLVGNTPGVVAYNQRLWSRKSAYTGQYLSKQITPTSGTAVNLVTISRSNITNSTSNIQTICGKIRLIAIALSGAGVPAYLNDTYQFTITSYANQVMAVTFSAVTAADNNGPGATLVLAGAGATASQVTLTATFTLAGYLSLILAAEIEYSAAYNSGFPPLAFAPQQI